jgi:hypothetical protein
MNIIREHTKAALLRMNMVLVNFGASLLHVLGTAEWMPSGRLVGSVHNG